MLDWIRSTRKAWIAPLAGGAVLGLNKALALVPGAPTLGDQAELWVAGLISAVVVWLVPNK